MSQVKKLILLGADIIALYAALALTLVIRYSPDRFGTRWADHLLPFSLLFIAWVLIFSVLDLYRHKAFVNYNEIATRLITAVGTAIVASIVLFYLFENIFVLTPKTNLVIFAAVFTLIDYLIRSFFATAVRRGALPVVVIGNSPRIQELIAYLNDHHNSGYRVAKHLRALDPEHVDALPRTLTETNARIIIVQPSLAKDPDLIRSLYSLLALGVSIVSFPDFYELVFERVPLDDLEESWFIEHITTRRPIYDRAKRYIDFALALILMVALSPLLVLIGFLILLFSGSPVLFRQVRTGKNDAPFTMYKFRTMKHVAGGPLWTEEGDRRVTPIGKLLRATHLDELPQLWNIVRGHLSFTGPRAERSELVAQYRQFPYYGIRHVVQPGLTGWAQINYRPSASLEEAKEKLNYDVYYVKNRSFLLDLAIILKTAKYFFVSPK